MKEGDDDMVKAAGRDLLACPSEPKKCLVNVRAAWILNLGLRHASPHISRICYCSRITNVYRDSSQTQSVSNQLHS